MPQLFISYSSHDRQIAQEILHYLEKAEIDCWIAPRNIPPGTDWTEGIMHGILDCSVFLVVFSRAANQSKHVRREVGAACDHGRPVIPVRIENVTPSAQLGYYLNSVQWLDAVGPPALQSHLATILQRVKFLLQTGPDTQHADARPVPGQVDAAATIRGRRVQPFWRHPIGWLVGLGLGGLLISSWFVLHRSIQFTLDPRSIAVLPFQNLTSDPSSGYFADGIQEEILGNLAKIAQLHVTSRTSVMQYRGEPKSSLRQIAQTLGVNNVLEGTVQREGNRVRVSAELIDAVNDRTLWAERFDKELTDVFSIQSEVAQTVAERLRAQLTGEEEKRLEEKPTENLTAYDLYLQGKSLIYKGQNAKAEDSAASQIRDGISKLEQAVAADPRFTFAYCAIAQAYDYLYPFEPSVANRSAGDRAIDQARELEPGAPEVSFAWAYHLYVCYRDYEGALAELGKATSGLPNNADLLALQAYIARRQGRFSESVELFETALRLNPTSLQLIQEFAYLQLGLWHWKETEKLFERAIQLAPQDLQQQEQKAGFDFLRTGRTDAIKTFLSRLPPESESYRDFLSDRVTLAMSERDWALARNLASSMEEMPTFGWSFAPVNVPAKAFLLQIARFEGTSTEAYASLRGEFASRVTASARSPKLVSALALFDVWLGHGDLACTEAEEAVGLLPVSKDPVLGPELMVNLAVVYAWAGKIDAAFGLLEQWSELPYKGVNFGYGDFLRNPVWEPLRQDPRYQKILARLKPPE